MTTDERPLDEDDTTKVFVRLPTRERAVPSPAGGHQLWDANDVARYLKVSRSWVYHRAEAGLLPLRRVGGLLRFDPAEVRAFVMGKGEAPALPDRTSPRRRHGRSR